MLRTFFWTIRNCCRRGIPTNEFFFLCPQHERAKVEALLPGPLHIASEASGKVIFTNHP